MHEHLTQELFRAIASGWRNPGDLAGIALAHLFELCPDCRREFEAWRRELEDASVAPEAAHYRAVVDRICARIEPPAGRRESPISREIRDARGGAERLLRLEPERRADWLRVEAGRVPTSLLAEVLIEESRKRTPGYPRSGYVLADVARLVLQHGSTSLHNTTLYARSLAYMANAVRVIGDLPRADQLLGDVRYLLRLQGGGDRLVRAEVDGLEGSLRNSQARPQAAIPPLLRALMTYRLDQVSDRSAAILIKLAGAHLRLCQYQYSLILLAEADRALDDEPEPWLRLLILDNQAHCLCVSGQPLQAQELLDQGRRLAELRDDPLNHLRRLWKSAEIAWKLADLDLAEQRMVTVRSGFAAQGLRYDVALASLELGRLYIEQGRLHEAAELADEALPVFEELGVPAKVAAARGLRTQAATA